MVARSLLDGPLTLALLPVLLLAAPAVDPAAVLKALEDAGRALKSLLQEARVPLAVRAGLPLIFAADTLIAVAGLWLDASVQAGAGSRQRARLIWSAAG